MAAHLQQVAPIGNGAVPIMAGGQIVYQQPQQIMMAPGQQQLQQITPRKPYVPRERHPNEEQCKIFVGAVGKNTTDESLRAYFSKFGEIADSVIMMNKATGEPRGFAFVTFKTPQAVNAVMDQCNNGGHSLDGRMVDPKPAVPQGPSQQNKLHDMYDGEKPGNTMVQSNGNEQYKGPMKVASELKIFVGGVGIGTTEEDIKKYFSSFGTVNAVDMPYHHVYKCPKGFAFVGFESFDSVQAVTKDRYHQINGKTVEVKGSDEQQAHLSRKREGFQQVGRTQFRGPQQGNIATVSGYGAYALPQQVIVPQAAQYAVQMPQAAAGGGGYVFDPSTNTYYQLPATMLAGAGLAVGGAGAAAVNPYAGMTILNAGAAAGQQQVLTQQIRPGTITADMLNAGGVALGGVYSSETSTFGPSRSHVLGGHVQQPIGGNTVADPHVVYSNSQAISAGDVISTQPRGFHPYGR